MPFEYALRMLRNAEQRVAVLEAACGHVVAFAAADAVNPLGGKLALAGAVCERALERAREIDAAGDAEPVREAEAEPGGLEGEDAGDL